MVMRTLALHRWRGYNKGKTYTTYGFLTLFGQDIFDMFDIAAKRIDNLLGYNKNMYGVQFNSKTESSPET